MAIDVIYLGLSCVVAIASIVTSVFTTTNKKKKTRVLAVLANVVTYVQQAEQIFGNGNGKAKLQWVLTKVQIDCFANKVTISDDEIVKEIDKVLSTPQKKENKTTNDTKETYEILESKEDNNTNNIGYGQ